MAPASVEMSVEVRGREWFQRLLVPLVWLVKLRLLPVRVAYWLAYKCLLQMVQVRVGKRGRWTSLGASMVNL
jgi:hypothetical protein